MAQAWHENPLVAALHSREWIRTTPMPSPFIHGQGAGDVPLLAIVQRCGSDARPLLIGRPRPGTERVPHLERPKVLTPMDRSDAGLLDTKAYLTALVTSFVPRTDG